MISLRTGDFLEKPVENLIIPAERVAHVQLGNSLEHALLVLTKSGYTGIPVLDIKYKLCGLISTPLILDSIMGLQRIEFEKLEKKKVEDVMKQDIPTLLIHDSIKKGLKLLINHPFVCVVNEEKDFKGIFTRRAILKHVNAFIQQINHKEFKL